MKKEKTTGSKRQAKSDAGRIIWNPLGETSASNPGRPRGRLLIVGDEEKKADARIIFNPGPGGIAGGHIIFNPKTAGAENLDRRVLNCLPSRKVEQDWQFAHALAGGIKTPIPVPKAHDLRTPLWSVSDQGQTGSCVGWAAADGVIRWHWVNSRGLPAKQLLSARFLWMAAKETDQFTNYPTTFVELEGTSLKAALDVARKFGNLLHEDLPLTGALWQGEADGLYASAAQRRIASYFNLGSEIAKWKQWIFQHGPILTRLDVDSTWVNATATNGVLKTYKSGETSGGHAVAMVGYTEDSIIIRNSWGTGWGDQGFGYASLDYAQAAFTEAYGVAV